MRNESPPLKRPEKPSGASSSWAKIAPYALLSLVSFVLSSFLVLLLLKHARLLVSLGLEGRFYYFALLPLAVAVSGVLFGALRSVALYRGKYAGGTLELRGAVVASALVVIGGFFLPRPSSNFPLTVYVHGPEGQQDLLLRNHGEVLLDLGGDRRSASIGSKGQAFFSEIPANFRGQKVNVALDAPGYERSDNSRLELDETSLYLPIRRKSLRIAGNVIDETGTPIVGATVSVAGLSTMSVGQGRFELMLSSDEVSEGMVLHASAKGYSPGSWRVTPDGRPVTAMLHR